MIAFTRAFTPCSNLSETHTLLLCLVISPYRYEQNMYGNVANDHLPTTSRGLRLMEIRHPCGIRQVVKPLRVRLDIFFEYMCEPLVFPFMPANTENSVSPPFLDKI